MLLNTLRVFALYHSQNKINRCTLNTTRLLHLKIDFIAENSKEKMAKTTQIVTGKRWWVLRCKPHQDKDTEKRLQNQNYIVYRPTVSRMRKSRGKMILRHESLFPGYIFIELDQSVDNWTSARFTQGVIDYVRAGRSPLQAGKQLVDTLRQQECSYQEQTTNLDEYHAGQKITIETGPFKNLEGVFNMYDGEQRAIILITLLHQQTHLTISPSDISSV